MPRQSHKAHPFAADADVQKQIKELEDELQRRLATEPCIKLGAYKTTHTRLIRTYKAKITCLLTYGVTNPAKVKHIQDKATQTRYSRNNGKFFSDDTVVRRRQTNIARYGYPQGPLDKQQATKERLYGYKYINVDAARKTKLERYGSETYSNVAKAQQTKLAKYGNKLGDVKKQQATKLAKYRSIYGPNAIEHAVQTKIERYGGVFGKPEMAIARRRVACNGEYFHIDAMIAKHGVAYPCLLQQCRAAHGMIVSNVNRYVQEQLLIKTGIKFDTEFGLIRRSYDLHYNDVLIEINPTISHNSTYSWEFIVGRSKHNRIIAHDLNHQKTMLAYKHDYTCFSIFDWHKIEHAIDIICKYLLNELQYDFTQSTVEIDLSLTDMRAYLNAGYKLIDLRIDLHWFNMQTHEHLLDNGFDRQQMIASGFVEVYDCGHALLKKIEK